MNKCIVLVRFQCSFLNNAYKQKFNKTIEDLTNTNTYLDLIDMPRKFYPTTDKSIDTFFSTAHKIFAKIDCILYNRTNINDLRGLNHTQNVF